LKRLNTSFPEYFLISRSLHIQYHQLPFLHFWIFLCSKQIEETGGCRISISLWHWTPGAPNTMAEDNQQKPPDQLRDDLWKSSLADFAKSLSNKKTEETKKEDAAAPKTSECSISISPPLASTGPKDSAT